MKRLFVGLLLCLTPVLAQKPLDLSKPIPVDPDVLIKKLDNGLTYYIRKNAKPENRAELRLVVNAGSILETEEQLGLAHFLEHMAFNGTKNFEKQELIDYLESIGMRFGADINAYTSFDETVYMLEVPTDDQGVVDTAFQILEDWAHQITIDPVEVDKERGVVVEEWRRGRGAQMRIMQQQLPLLYKDSRYAERLPIGKVEVIENAPAEQLAKFYRDWYRPDLMAVVAVGDFDPKMVEAKIKKHFGHLKNPKNAPERVMYDVPPHKETLFQAVTDPELTNATLRIEYKRAGEETKTLADMRRGLLEGLYQAMLNDRLAELLQQANPPFLFGSASSGSYARTAAAFRQFAVVQETGFETGLRALLTEAARVKRHGFTQSELDRKRAEYLRSLESAYKERDKTEHRDFIGEYVNHFLEGEMAISAGQSLELGKAILPTIQLDEVNKATENWITEENRVILLAAPEKEGLKLPTKDAVLGMIKEIAAADVAPYADNASEEPLIAKVPKPGKVTAEHQFESVGVTKWELSNGATVYLKPTDFKNDEILFSSSQKGGSSLVDADDLIAVGTTTAIMGQSGLGAFDAIQLRKKTADKLVRVGPYIGSFSQGLNGACTPEDLETMFQLAHLYYTAPRFDQKAFLSVKNRYQAIIKNRSSRPETVWGDERQKVLYQDHPRRQPWTAARLEHMSLETSRDTYQRLFSDVGGTNYVFVGNFDLAAMKPLVETYLASLPGTDAEKNWRDTKDRRVKGRKEVVVRKGSEPKAIVSLLYHGEAEFEQNQVLPLMVLNRVLTIRLREIMREDMGGVYNVGVGGSQSRLPIGSFSNRISFSCNPEKVDELVKAANDEIQRLIKDGFEEPYLQKVTEALHREHEVDLKENSYWRGVIGSYVRWGLPFERILGFEDRLKGLTIAKVQGAAARYYGDANYLEAVLLPEAESAGKTN
ncbi:M16 family metallopeptidase [Acanthopleuribacter pedis]|uniref:Insulinase family protein n=1 Tax=Acanthopleuribacter pedis TaxID=442870 RepID=A0A8J7U669_9BACT|nr:insulinase family protein [Acanthopleuribacter pedis]MBO1321599.1 insulinase family protein [Acanthopleuribacter pedis]